MKVVEERLEKASDLVAKEEMDAMLLTWPVTYESLSATTRRSCY